MGIHHMVAFKSFLFHYDCASKFWEMISFNFFISCLLAERFSKPILGTASKSINPECQDEQAAVACEDDCFFEQYTCLSECGSDDRDCITGCNREYTKVRFHSNPGDGSRAISRIFHLVPWSLPMLHWMLFWMPLSISIAVLLWMWREKWKWIHGLQIENSIGNGWLHWRMWAF